MFSRPFSSATGITRAPVRPPPPRSSGARLSSVEVSAHAIDRLSTRHLEKWRHNARSNEGLYSWAERMTEMLAAEWRAGTYRGCVEKIDGRVKILHIGIGWVIDLNMVVPVLLTAT